MVAFSPRRQKGNGIIDTILKPFTAEKYAGEQHAYSLDRKHFLQPYNFVGPHTQLRTREQRHDDVPLNDLDEYAKEHDYAYEKEYNEYQHDHNKPLHIQRIWDADDTFVKNASHSRDDPIMGKITGKLIQTKEALEKKGILDTKRFEGFGKKSHHDNSKRDPAHRLKMLAMQQQQHEKQDGGAFPAFLIPIVAPIVANLAEKAFSAIYDKIKGKGVKLGQKSRKEKLELIQQLLNHINK
jgi:hypothetical protein